MNCLNCNAPLKRKKSTYCSNQCQIDYQYKQWVTRWKNGEVSGLKGKYEISDYLKRYLREKYHNKCSRCGWCEVNPYTGHVPLEVEHIDGDYLNNKEENLDLICPNCHSLTSTYKGANRGKGRKFRAKYSL